MKCKTELHGGVYHQTSTSQKSGNKMKRKKTNDTSSETSNYIVTPGAMQNIQCQIVL